ncbi:MAG: ABC transporter substrate-binding protein [Bacilli bacterium]|nr:ABC transporter substrate-binding protein [Bacilli bacterium]
MKKSNALLVTALASVLTITVAGCKKQIKVEPKTLNVKLLLGGYGYEWMNNLITKFQEVYKEEGYKVNLIKPTRQNDGGTVYNDLLEGYAKKSVDLYFTGSLSPTRVYNEGDVLVEELDDLVYDQKAIDFNGNEEEKTVREKLDKSFGADWYQANGKSYNFFYQNSIGALVVNTDKLARCGFDYLPVTTNQFFNMVHTITENERRVKPITTVGNTGYASVMINSWLTQLGGRDEWDTFWSMNNPDGSYNTASGYEVYNSDNLRQAGAMVFETYDFKNFVKGAKNYSIEKAHDSLMADYEDGGGVFLFDGDWALNETAANYPDDADLSKLSFINVPLASGLGTKLWGPGTDANITDAAKVEDILVKVVKGADAGKEVSQITSEVNTEFSVSLTEASVLRVCEARGVYNNRGVETGNAYLAKGIDDTHKDIAGKFLRMIASDDFSRMYFETSHCFSPYSKAVNNSEGLLPFTRSQLQIGSHKYASTIWPQLTGLRKEIGSNLGRFSPTTNTGYFHTNAELTETSAYDDRTGRLDPEKVHIYYDQASDLVKKDYDFIKGEWSRWLENIQK